MPSERIELFQSDCDIEAALRRGVDVLQEGGLVVLPTETVYGVAALASHSRAVQRLIEAKGRSSGCPFALAISGIDSLYDYVPDPEPLAERLARRCWPGPVTLVLPADTPGSAIRQLPEAVRETVLADGFAGFRVPNHPFTQTVLGELNEPVILTSANRSGCPDALTAEAATDALGDALALVFDDGPASGGLPSTVVRVVDHSYTVLREGGIKRETIDRLTARMILFVCTGNTCRSPMAEAICEKLLADRLGCHPKELEERGYVVLSAGVAAGYEATASPHADQAVHAWARSLKEHRSQQLNENHVRFADRIYALTRGHREAILSYWPNVDTRLSVLRMDGGDIPDPIGGSLAEYEHCAERIAAEIEKRLDEIVAGYTEAG